MAKGVWRGQDYRGINNQSCKLRRSLPAQFSCQRWKASDRCYISETFPKCKHFSTVVGCMKYRNFSHESKWNPNVVLAADFWGCYVLFILQDEQLLDSERHCVYLIEKALSQLPPGGETFLGIFDLRGFKQKNGDLKFTKFLVTLTQRFTKLLLFLSVVESGRSFFVLACTDWSFL